MKLMGIADVRDRPVAAMEASKILDSLKIDR